MTLINHEIMEKRLIQEGMGQDEAHIKTSAKYNYDKEAREFYGKINVILFQKIVPYLGTLRYLWIQGN